MRHQANDNDFWDQGFDEEFEEDFRPRSGSTDLVSVPASVRQQLANARETIQQTQHQMIQAAMQMAVTELAKASPEHFAGVVLQQIGGRPVTLSETETDQYIEVIERKVLGITVGTDVKTTTHIRRHSKQITF